MGLYRKIDDNKCVNIINKIAEYTVYIWIRFVAAYYTPSSSLTIYFRIKNILDYWVVIRDAFLSCTLVTSLNFSTISGKKKILDTFNFAWSSVCISITKIFRLDS
jgi:hypothetical protein